jgi:hypothetical protein
VIICAAGDIHGSLDRLYADVLAFEAALGVRFEWVLHVGDFGVWPDPNRIDRATRNHEGAGDFPAWFAANRPVPRRTLFIKGNHEDFVWLDGRSDPELLPGLFYLANGGTFELGPRSIQVGGIGGCFGPSDFDRQSKRLHGYARRHYTRDEIDTLVNKGRVDVLLVHDAPAPPRSDTGPRFVPRGPDAHPGRPIHPREVPSGSSWGDTEEIPPIGRGERVRLACSGLMSSRREDGIGSRDPTHPGGSAD